MRCTVKTWTPETKDVNVMATARDFDTNEHVQAFSFDDHPSKVTDRDSLRTWRCEL